MSGFYDEGLAYVHHNGFGELARKAGDHVLSLLARAGHRSGLVVDLGCGSGIWASKLIDNGYRALGVDASSAMIALARTTAPGADYRTASLYDVELPASCVAVTALGEGLGYGRAGVAADSAMAELFAKVAHSLVDGGLFVFDVIVRAGSPSLDGRSWWRGPDWAVLVETSELSEASELRREITVFRERPGGYRRSEEAHRVRVLDAERLLQTLRRAGLDAVASPTYGSHALSPRRLAFVARKI